MNTPEQLHAMLLEKGKQIGMPTLWVEDLTVRALQILQDFPSDTCVAIYRENGFEIYPFALRDDPQEWKWAISGVKNYLEQDDRNHGYILHNGELLLAHTHIIKALVHYNRMDLDWWGSHAENEW